MPKGLPHIVRGNLAKCRGAALAAVETYNRPGPHFRTAQYLILIIIAWTALLHAISYHRGRRPWYRKKTSGKGKGIRYIKIDGEPKHWDLAMCLNRFYGDDNPPERKNLQFLLGLRNKIEHRHLPELDPSLYGECQSALLNLEDLLVNTFGEKHALAEQLAVSLQFSRVLPDEKRAALKALTTTTTKGIRDYIERFRTGLPSPILNSMKYSFNVFLVPRVANRQSAADAAVQFVKVDEASAEELQRLERLNVLIREKHIPIANLDLHRPKDVVDVLHARLPFQFTLATHTAAWKYFRVRPQPHAPNPERTAPEYCVYNAVHRDYLYTQAWIDKLVRDLATHEGFRTVVGQPPRPKH